MQCSSVVLLLISYINFYFLTFDRGFSMSSALIITAISWVQRTYQKIFQGKDAL